MDGTGWRQRLHRGAGFEPRPLESLRSRPENYGSTSLIFPWQEAKSSALRIIAETSGPGQASGREGRPGPYVSQPPPAEGSAGSGGRDRFLLPTAYTSRALHSDKGDAFRLAVHVYWLLQISGTAAPWAVFGIQSYPSVLLLFSPTAPRNSSKSDFRYESRTKRESRKMQKKNFAPASVTRRRVRTLTPFNLPQD
jgi:hypothetical protein